MIKKEDTFIIGKFQKTHALKGELNAIIDIDPQCFDEGIPLIVEIDGILVPFYLESYRKKGSFSNLIKIDGINSEEEASKFVNKDIRMQISDAKELGINQDSDEDLIGYTIIDVSSLNEVGIIEDIDDSTENILFIVNNSKENSLFVPAVDEFISEIDDEKKKIYMNLPEGLIEINSRE